MYMHVEQYYRMIIVHVHARSDSSPKMYYLNIALCTQSSRL